MAFYLGIDLGTSYFKLGLFDEQGRLKGLGRKSVPVKSPSPGYAEVSAEDFEKTLADGISDALCEANAKPQDISALAYASQANSFILLNSQFTPLTPLILWTDARAKELDSAAKKWASLKNFANTTGLAIEIGGGMMAAKLRWFATRNKKIWDKTRHIMTVSDYLAYLLTGSAIGDSGSAALTGLIDIHTQTRWPAAMNALELDTAMFSDIVSPGSVGGTVCKTAEEKFPLPQNAAVILGSLDHYIAAIGAGAGSLAEMSESTGTVLACLKIDAHISDAPSTIAGPAGDGKFYQLAYSNYGASLLENYCKANHPQLSVGKLVALAEKSSADCNGLSMKYGNFVNEKSSHTPGDHARAIMNFITQTLAELTATLYDGKKPQAVVATGGGAKSDLWLAMYASTLGAKIIRTCCAEPAAKGAAILAAVGCGKFESLSSAANAWINVEKIFSPSQK